MRAARAGTLAFVALAGVAQSLCFAPGPLPGWLTGPLQLFAMAALVHCVWRAPTPRTAAVRAWIFSFAGFSVGLYWLTISMHVYGFMPLPLAIAALLGLCAYLALFGAVAAWIAARIEIAPAHEAHRRAAGGILSSVVWACAWTIGEWLRAIVLTGFPWMGTGYAQTDTWLSGWAPVLGVYGVTFLAALAAALLASLAAQSSATEHRGSRIRTLGALIAIFGVAAILAQFTWSKPAGDPLSVRLVQSNIEQGIKFAPQQWLESVRKQYSLAAQPGGPGAQQPRLVLLPETAIVLFQHQVDPAIWQAWQTLAASQGSTIVMGAPLVDRSTNRYTNSVIAIDGATSLDALIGGRPAVRYDKHHLVPFGEFVPLGFRWFVDLMSIPLGDFGRGELGQRPFLIRDQSIAPNICYEDIFGEELLASLRPDASGVAGASIIANVSNLGWFGDSWALRQHWQMARMRAIETARPVIRATNTGITGAIDARGQAISQLPAHIASALDVVVQGQSGLTPYARLGNWPIILACAVALAGIGVGRRRKT